MSGLIDCINKVAHPMGIEVTTKPKVSQLELMVSVGAIAIFASASVVLGVAAPFTAVALVVPALICALIALGIGAYLAYQYNKADVKKAFNEVGEETNRFIKTNEANQEDQNRIKAERAQKRAKEDAIRAENKAERERYIAELRAGVRSPKPPVIKTVHQKSDAASSTSWLSKFGF